VDDIETRIASDGFGDLLFVDVEFSCSPSINAECVRAHSRLHPNPESYSP
jgi:hypothetical protein